MLEFAIAVAGILGVLFVLLLVGAAGWYLLSREPSPVSARDLRAIRKDLEKKAQETKMANLYRQVAESGGYEVSDK